MPTFRFKEWALFGAVYGALLFGLIFFLVALFLTGILGATISLLFGLIVGSIFGAISWSITGFFYDLFFASFLKGRNRVLQLTVIGTLITILFQLVFLGSIDLVTAFVSNFLGALFIVLMVIVFRLKIPLK